jgi:DNA replication protein DnaC
MAEAFSAKARFPALEGFYFSFQPSLPVTLIKELARLDFLGRGKYRDGGASGPGKTHLLTALALKACEARKRVLFVSAPDLLEQPVAAR